MTWAQLGTPARLFRVAHATWGIFNMLALAELWRAGLLRRRNATVFAAASLLSTEGVALVVGRGNCPFGTFQTSLGDPVPMFEWFLPARAAKAAVPLLSIAAIAGLAWVAMRPPGSAKEQLVVS